MAPVHRMETDPLPLNRVIRRVVDDEGVIYELPVLTTPLDARGFEFRIAGRPVLEGYAYYLTKKHVDGWVLGLGRFLSLGDAKANLATMVRLA